MHKERDIKIDIIMSDDNFNKEKGAMKIRMMKECKKYAK